ncbi:B3 domain-containing protein [Quillaja saponaria]|uniref:B3 domain-containing protein n=1 Tax=Quillaja saponaria TaxID=32244 RepID=A0AAD7L3K2_QUISA|nr:B3 domain-containing protein [Quillaja saponaria]
MIIVVLADSNVVYVTFGYLNGIVDNSRRYLQWVLMVVGIVFIGLMMTVVGGAHWPGASKKGTTVDENGADHDAGSKGTDGDGSERTEVINIDEEIGSGKSLESWNADVPRMRKHKEGTSSSEVLQEAKALRFRVILEHDLVRQGFQVLKMPSDLFTRLGRELKKVVLKDLVSNKLREVDVKKDGENCYFHKGWKEFVECTLQRYKKYLLVFKCVEDSLFEVKKYGKVSCEKKANSIANHHEQMSKFVGRPTKCKDNKSNSSREWSQ